MTKTIKQIKEDFISRMVAALANVESDGKLLNSVTIAQAAIESNWGRSALSAKYNNYFGVKAGSSWRGKTVNFKTGEVFDGKNVVISSNFRVYDSLEESITDRNALLHIKRYKRVLEATTPEAQVKAIKDCGYCTSQHYVDSLMTTIRANNLTQYDEK